MHALDAHSLAPKGGVGGGGPMPTSQMMASTGGHQSGPGLSSHSRLHKYLGNSSMQMSTNAPPFIPSSQFSQMSVNEHMPPHSQTSGFHPISTPFGSHKMQHQSQMMQDQMQFQQEMGPPFFYQDGTSSPMIDNGGMIEEMIPPEGHTIVQSNGGFMYQCATPPHIGKFRPKNSAGNNVAQFINPDLKLELLNRQLAIECRTDRNIHPNVPAQIDHLNYIVPLENINSTHATQSSFKALSVKDGVPYYIRRIHGFRTQNSKQMQPLENWKKLVHVNVAQLREYITNCRAFGDYSLLLVYDYYPLAETLKSRHFGKGSGFIDALSGAKISQQHQNQMSVGVPEVVIWSYIVQLASAIRCIHASGLAVKGLQPSRVLVYGRNKILISCVGLSDITATESIPIQQHQSEDLNAFGRIILGLATGNQAAARKDLFQQSMHYMMSNYTQDFQKIISFLLSPSNTKRTIHEIMPYIGAKFYAQLEAAQMKSDTLEAELSKELENGRLFRLLCKLNTIWERPENNLDPQWAETGDRYLLKLFRGYVFHQVMENGRPWLDMAHMIHCLNKLDAGSSEKIELVAREGDTLVIVSYADLKRCFETAFRELCSTTNVSIGGMGGPSQRHKP